MGLFSSKLDLKPVFQVLFGLIVIGALGALALSFSLDKMVASGLEDSTSKMLNTSVEVDQVAISLLDGSGTISGITIHNPDGFSDKPAIKLQGIHIDLKITSLLSDTVLVNEVHIQKPELYFEQKASGNNFDVLTDNMGGSSSGDTNLIVDHLLVENGTVMLTADIGQKKSVVAEFSKIELEGIGRSGNNAMQQTLRQILEPVLQKALQEAVKQGLMENAKDALKELLEG